MRMKMLLVLRSSRGPASLPDRHQLGIEGGRRGRERRTPSPVETVL